MVFLKLLGPPEIVFGGKTLSFHRKSLAVLAYLSLSSSRRIERSQIADLFWPTLPKPQANHNLRLSLHALRKAFGASSPLLTTRTHVGIDPSWALGTDCDGIFSPSPDCRIFHDPADCPVCLARMKESIEGIRGPFFEGFSLEQCEEFEIWATAMRESLQVRVREILSRLLSFYEKTGNVAEALSALDGVLRLDPLDEACHGRKMLLLSESGNRLAALNQYEILRKAFREALGVDPGPETQAILEKIRKPSLLKEASPSPLRTPLYSSLAALPEWRPATALHIEISPASADEDERFRMVVALLSEKIAAKAKDHGGMVARIQNGSLLFLFGIQEVTEGASRQAARAARSIVGLVDRAREESGLAIHISGGIHSGRILGGEPAAPPDPTGTVSKPSMALSLQASPGEILVSERASRLLRGQFDLEVAGEVRILGQKMRVFVLGDHVQDDLSGFIPRQIVGRDREMAALIRRWRDGRAGVVVVEGEAGIGKTALVRSFLGSNDLRDARLRRLECAPQFMSSPFFPFVRMIRGPAKLPEGIGREEGYARLQDYSRIFSFDDEKKAVAILGHFFSLPPHPAFPLPEMSASRLREETSTLLLSILRYRALEGKGLYFVEDLHWIDASSGDLLRKILMDPFFTERILFLLTTRTGEDPPWLGEIPDRTILRLAPLEDDETRTMVRTLGKEGSGGGLSGEEEDLVVRTSDGVPLFVEELVRERLERVETSSGKIRDRVPATLSEVLASRLDRLGEARSLVQTASVYGRVVPLTLLRKVFSGDPEPFQALLARATESGLVATETDLSGASLTFRHALIVEASRLSVTQSSRLLLHKRYAETLRDSFPDRAGATPELVALHFEEAGLISEALLWYEKAARISYERGAFLEAQRFLEKAFALLARLRSPDSEGIKADRNVESRLLILRGNLLVDTEGYGSRGARQSFRKALDIIDVETGVSEEAFHALYGYWDSLYGGMDIRESRKAADSLLGLSRKSESAGRRIASLYADGSTAFWEGRFARSFEVLAQGLSLGSEGEGRGEGGGLLREAALVQSANYQFWNLWFLGRYRSALSAVEESLGRVSENVQKKGHLLTFSAVTFRYLRLPERVFGVLDGLGELIGTTGIEGWRPSETGFRGWAQVMTGNPSGIVSILKAVRLSRKFHRMAEIKYLALLAEGYLALSDVRRARGVVDSALRYSKKSGTVFFDAEFWRLRGEILRRSGEVALSREALLMALEVSRKQGARALELRSAVSLAGLLESVGKRAQALPVLDSVRDLVEGPESDPSLPDLRDAGALLERLG